MTDDGRRWAMRAAAIVLWLNGLGFGLFALFPLWSLSTGGGIPIVMGFPTYGGGPFEQHGVPTSIPLVLLFLAVCVAEVVAGALLWRGRRAGGSSACCWYCRARCSGGGSRCPSGRSSPSPGWR